MVRMRESARAGCLWYDPARHVKGMDTMPREWYDRESYPQEEQRTTRRDTMGHQDHQEQARADAATRVIHCAIITASDTRTPETDTSGAAIRAGLIGIGCEVLRYDVVRDEPSAITALVQQAAAAGCQVIITNGGTGIARRDSTIEAIDDLLEKRLPGFGEIFRMLSYHAIGPAAMLSRATAGVFGGALVFCLPGSTNAVELALERLILPELHHLVWETVRT